MRIEKIYSGILYTWLVLVVTSSCNKQDTYLDKKRNNSDVVPSTIANYQALLDNVTFMNQNIPTSGLLGADNYYLTNSVYGSLVPPQNTAYNWVSDIWQGGTSIEWNDAYQAIEYANICLNGLDQISVTASTASAYNNVKGSALFFRAFQLYNLANLYCTSYKSASANTDLGLPIRLTSDLNVKSTRSTVQQTYTQIISDLKEALPLLPATPLKVTRPSSIAATALLAKVYLAMEAYDSARVYADATLSAKGDILNFNTTSLVNPSATLPFPSNPASHPEMIFLADGITYVTIKTGGTGIVDSVLYKSYDSADLRKTVFYRITSGQPQFKGSYDCYYWFDFAGLATNEIYFIRAECAARAGDITAAMKDVNNVLTNRYVTGKFTSPTISNPDSALSFILRERRKELPFTGNIRWEDLRRLNKDPQYAITLKRVINGTIYTLPPNDPKYVLPLPDNEIQLSSLQQNSR